MIPVHVSMEELAMKRKVDKGTSVNAVVDGKETTAKTRLIQVPTKFRNVLHYTFVAYVNSTVPFFPKLVIPVHVSMEEPVLKTKAEKSTSVNAVVDGKETIAKITLMQVPPKLRNVLYYAFVAYVHSTVPFFPKFVIPVHVSP